MTTINDYIQDYRETPHVTSLAKATRDGYSFALQDLGKFCKKHGIKKIEDVEKNLHCLGESLKGNGITDQTIYHKFTCIKIFLKWAGFPSQYTFSISNTGKKAFKLKHARRWLSQGEIGQCRVYGFPKSVNAARDKLIVGLLMDTGCRARELSTLRGGDIELEKGTMFLSDSKTEPRPAFFSRETYELMAAYRDEVGAQKFIGRLFPAVDRIKKIVTDMLEDLGLKNGKDGRGPHVFRHYFASYLFFCGNMRIEEVATLMGDTVDTVRAVYLHCPVDVLKLKTRRGMGWK